MAWIPQMTPLLHKYMVTEHLPCSCFELTPSVLLLPAIHKISAYCIKDRSTKYVTGPVKTGHACGHKLYPVTLQVISQYWNRIFVFCNMQHKANYMRTKSGKLHYHSIIVHKVMSDESLKK